MKISTFWNCLPNDKFSFSSFFCNLRSLLPEELLTLRDADFEPLLSPSDFLPSSFARWDLNTPSGVQCGLWEFTFASASLCRNELVFFLNVDLFPSFPWMVRFHLHHWHRVLAVTAHWEVAPINCFVLLHTDGVDTRFDSWYFNCTHYTLVMNTRTNCVRITAVTFISRVTQVFDSPFFAKYSPVLMICLWSESGYLLKIGNLALVHILIFWCTWIELEGLREGYHGP